MSGPRGDDDGGRRSPDPDGLPGFPAEWGRIVIPDDAAELDHEAARVRRELRREVLFRRYGLRSSQRLHHLALPLILVTMAILVTTTSLFAAMWPQGSRTATGDRRPSGSPTAVQTGAPLPDLRLTGATGHAVALRDTHPVVVLLVRHCACTGLVAGTVQAAAHRRITVLVVGAGTEQPALPTIPTGAHVVTAVDPDGILASAVAAGARATPATDTGGALLVDRHGTVRSMVPSTRSAADFTDRLPALVA
ncbi:hypothetical protein [Actinocatenispora rupis]|uniref:hypothetical protein n=1 Tax=Actinocatenispora rupis TaxID=519421 RepID=UPI0019455E79|nr:hypothetical protein [Actinocatenispora rupis]